MRNPIPIYLGKKINFGYGWVILLCLCLANISRQSGAVATLSMFMEPMCTELNWSRTSISGAVSIGGLIAAAFSPIIGRYTNLIGGKIILISAILMTGVSCIFLSKVDSLLVFYILFTINRMSFQSPYDLGIYSIINNWFIKYRIQISSVMNFMHGIGLFILPVLCGLIILHSDWRLAWLSIGLLTLVLGLIPVIFLLIDKPDNILHRVDFKFSNTENENKKSTSDTSQDTYSYTLKEATRNPIFWLLMSYSAIIFPVQAGASLHQAPYLFERGIKQEYIVYTIGIFSIFSALGGLFFSWLNKKYSIRFCFILSSLILSIGTFSMLFINNIELALFSAITFGIALGGILTLMPVSWIDFFGRKNFPSIRGVALTVQILAQASGPLIAGIVRDLNGNYELAITIFSIFSVISIFIALYMKTDQKNHIKLVANPYCLSNFSITCISTIALTLIFYPVV